MYRSEPRILLVHSCFSWLQVCRGVRSGEGTWSGERSHGEPVSAGKSHDGIKIQGKSRFAAASLLRLPWLPVSRLRSSCPPFGRTIQRNSPKRAFNCRFHGGRATVERPVVRQAKVTPLPLVEGRNVPKEEPGGGRKLRSRVTVPHGFEDAALHRRSVEGPAAGGSRMTRGTSSL